MTEIDLSRLPTGERGWAALIDWAAASDDRLERYFLELKSDVDPSAKHGQHKVAKFILGAANRDPAKAAKRFGGHALLLLGIGPGTATGIPPFEAKDLDREVRKFTGAEGPDWDYERIPVDAGHDIIAIIVGPPTGRIWPCLADGEKLTNGDVYLRGDGDTRKATGTELEAMLARTPTTAALPDIAVDVVGEALAIHIDPDRLTAFIQDTAEDYLSQVAAATPAFPFSGIGGPGIIERRSEDEFRREVQRWRDRALADPLSGVTEIAARLGAGIRLRVINPVKTSLRDVRIDIEFDGPIRALDWEDPDDDPQVELFPDRPVDWGRSSIASFIGAGIANRFLPASSSDGILRIVHDRAPTRLSLSLDLLRAEETFLSEDHEVVLLIPVAAETDEPITARWRLTAGDVHDVLDGTLTIPVDHRDWTDAVTQLTGG